MNHYKSWSGLHKQLSDFLCEPLKNRITYFLTRYHRVHNAYGRAAILLDKKELVQFSWIEMYKQEYEISKQHALYHQALSYHEIGEKLKTKWDENCTYCEMDFLSAATNFLQMSVFEALNSDNHIIRIFAILDNRVGKRTLQDISAQKNYQILPEWVRQFYELRLDVSNC